MKIFAGLFPGLGIKHVSKLSNTTFNSVNKPLRSRWV